jgi:hypothetical protein
MDCKACSGAGSVETTVKLDIGSRKERKQCSACGGSGKRNQQRIEIQGFQSVRETCYIRFDGKHYSLSHHDNFVAIDLEGEAMSFFAKWQPASQSTYLRERRAKEKKQTEERARQEELRQQELTQRRINEGLCLTCGKGLGFMDKMSGRQIHKHCS